jgi:hypothetical protein
VHPCHATCSDPSGRAPCDAPTALGRHLRRRPRSARNPGVPLRPIGPSCQRQPDGLRRAERSDPPFPRQTSFQRRRSRCGWLGGGPADRVAGVTRVAAGPGSRGGRPGGPGTTPGAAAQRVRRSGGWGGRGDPGGGVHGPGRVGTQFAARARGAIRCEGRGGAMGGFFTRPTRRHGSSGGAGRWSGGAAQGGARPVHRRSAYGLSSANAACGAPVAKAAQGGCG